MPWENRASAWPDDVTLQRPWALVQHLTIDRDLPRCRIADVDAPEGAARRANAEQRPIRREPEPTESDVQMFSAHEPDRVLCQLERIGIDLPQFRLPVV